MWIRTKLPDECGVAAWPIGAPGGTPLGEEESLIHRAVPARRAAFVAGRMAARQALAEIGFATRPLPAHPEGDPIWPDHVVGSITHAEGWAVAAVAKRSTLRGLGLDLEGATPLEAGVAEIVCRPEEREAEPGLAQAGVNPVTLRFVAKEAWYKAIFPAWRRVVGFQDVLVEIDATGGRFSARFVGSMAEGGSRSLLSGEGNFLHVDGLLCAVCALPAETS